MARLTHLGKSGEARMVDVTTKPATDRVAVAEGDPVEEGVVLATID